MLDLGMAGGAGGDGEVEFDRPTGVAVDKDGIIYVTDFKNDRLQVFDADGSFITKLTGEATLSKWGRERVALDPSMVRGRERAQGLQEREKLFHGPSPLTCTWPTGAMTECKNLIGTASS